MTEKTLPKPQEVKIIEGECPYGCSWIVILDPTSYEPPKEEIPFKPSSTEVSPKALPKQPPTIGLGSK